MVRCSIARRFLDPACGGRVGRSTTRPPIVAPAPKGAAAGPQRTVLPRRPPSSGDAAGPGHGPHERDGRLGPDIDLRVGVGHGPPVHEDGKPPRRNALSALAYFVSQSSQSPRPCAPPPGSRRSTGTVLTGPTLASASAPLWSRSSRENRRSIQAAPELCSTDVTPISLPST